MSTCSRPYSHKADLLPELPEVETVRRALEEFAVDRRITRIGGRSIQMRRPLDVPQLRRMLSRRIFVSVRRRGKYLLLDTDAKGVLLVHLGMSGRITMGRRNTETLPHTHLVVGLDSGRELRLVDPRRFGFAAWLGLEGEATDPSLSRLGIEPLDASAAATLPPLFRSRNSPIKSLLLNQQLVAGVGNIYAVEALWRAGIRPSRKGRRISLSRLERLTLNLQRVLGEAIEQGGTTIRDFASPQGNLGYFAVRLQVYGRAGQPCTRCETTLKDIPIGGRTTPFCPSCQR